MTPNDQPQGDPVIHVNPTAPPEPNPHAAGHSRRAFLFKLSLVINGAVGAILAIPIIGYIFGPAVKKADNVDSWIKVGPVTDFPEGETRLVNFRNPVTTAWDGETGDIPCWVRRISGNNFQVFAINCAHLGCPVRWFSQAKLFLCPCHGGAYYADGSRASGPPDRGLFEYAHQIDGDSLMIKVGKMPTLAAPGSAQSLVTIDGTDKLAALNAADKPKPRCSSCPG
jgi:menaquinol-cytochrome c reductase iron-sulfur subunit